jgi:outer membrane protein
MVAPLIELSYKKIYVQGIQAGYRFSESERFSFHARASVVFSGLDPDDSEFLDGMTKRKSTLEGGFVFDWKPGRYRVSTGIFTDLLGRSHGQQATADFARAWTFHRYRWGITPSIGLVWQSSSYVDYYYGVRPEEARPARPAFQGHSVVNLRSSVFGFLRLNARTQLVGLIRVQRLDNEIYESPIVDRRRGFFALAGVTYRFGKLPPRPS